LDPKQLIIAKADQFPRDTWSRAQAGLGFGPCVNISISCS
jgi:hypothetical protein